MTNLCETNGNFQFWTPSPSQKKNKKNEHEIRHKECEENKRCIGILILANKMHIMGESLSLLNIKVLII
jgi:hypothetical protein